MAERGFDWLGLCLKTAVLSDCSLCLIMFFSFPRCRLIIDTAGSSGPSGTGAYTGWARVRTLIRRLVRLRRLGMVHDELDHADAVDFMLIKLVSKLCALSEVHTTVVS